jgi:hypothetical protein
MGHNGLPISVAIIFVGAILGSMAFVGIIIAAILFGINMP